MDQQHPTRPTQQPSDAAPGYQPPVAAQQFAVAGAAGPDLVKRGLALFIDFAIIGVAYFFVAMVLGIPLGWMGRMLAALAAAAAVLVRDVALDGRSPGKKILGMAAVGPDGAPVTAQQSVMRNSTLAVGYLLSAFGAIPILGLLAIPLSLVSFALGCYEVFLVATNKPRLGDQLAGGTHVVFQGQPAIAL
jgi:uncharacterized RDD family membrane protein YckC